MQKLFEIKKLTKHFPLKKGFWGKQTGAVQAVNNLDLIIYKGETLGLVGESGCGKSTAGRCIIGLIPSTKGEIIYNGVDISKLSPKELKKQRKNMQIVFQNPFSSLNPRMTIKEILQEPFLINKIIPKTDINNRVFELANMVGLGKDVLNRYPHEFSGGQRQRIAIARALALNPEFIVADEPVSALDVSIQAQIINILLELKQNLGLTYLFISHDLSVIRYISDRVAVMYLGEIVEIAPVDSLFRTPAHPYTKILLNAVPVADPNRDLSDRIIVKGDIPSPANPPSGCKFHTRCPNAMTVCSTTSPVKTELTEGHYVLCHLYSN
jgi:peptide/nickel transport system ATP-binding protein